MGDRATLQLTFGDQGGIYLYTHWNGHDMPLRLQSALALAQGDARNYLWSIVEVAEEARGQWWAE